MLLFHPVIPAARSFICLCIFNDLEKRLVIRPPHAMTLRTVMVMVCMLAVVRAVAQEGTGFYMVVNLPKKACTKWLESRDGKAEFCVAPDPLITSSEFESVSGIVLDPIFNYINLTFTTQGFEKYKTISNNLKGAEMALVISNKVVGVFRSEGKIPKRTLQIGENISLADLEWIHANLK